MIRFARGLVWALLVLGASQAAAQTGNEESQCRTDANVFFCENWQDRSLGFTDMVHSNFKHPGWSTSHAGGNSELTIINRTGPLGTTVHVLDEVFPDCTGSCSNESNGGDGFMDSVSFGGKPHVYTRWYEQWANWTTSGVAAKNLELNTTASVATNVFLAHQMHGNDQNLGVQYSSGVVVQDPQTTNVTLIPQDVGANWVCLEVETQLGASSNGITRMWINGDLKISRTNETNVSGAGDVYSLRIATNWNCTTVNCAGNHGSGMHRYLTNILMSTAPIGCLTSTPDTTVPSTPTNLAATAAGSTQINLAWTPSTDNVSVVNYSVERCPGAGCVNYTEISRPPQASFVDTGLTPGTLYRYRVLARDGANNVSAYSAIAQATTQAGRQVTLHWTPGTGQASQTVARCVGSGCTTWADLDTSLAAGATTYVDLTSPLPVAGYKVYGVNGGQTSAASNLVYTDTIPSPILSVFPTTLTFVATVGGANPGSQSLTITNNVVGSAPMSWTAQKDQAWISSVTPSAGTNTTVVTVAVSIAGLTAGIYSANITVTAPGATGSPVVIPVALNLSPVITPAVGRGGRVR